jgi:hypothetical protein
LKSDFVVSVMMPSLSPLLMQSFSKDDWRAVGVGLPAFEVGQAVWVWVAAQGCLIYDARGKC